MDVTETTKPQTHWDWMLEQWTLERERSAAYIAQRRNDARMARPAALPPSRFAMPAYACVVDDENDDQVGDAMEALPAL